MKNAVSSAEKKNKNQYGMVGRGLDPAKIIL